MRNHNHRSEAGFSLVELALAISIVAFCILPILGLMPIGLNAIRDASEQTGAMNIASLVTLDLESATSSAITSTAYGISLPTTQKGSTNSTEPLYLDKNGKVVTSAASAEYRVIVQLPSLSQQNTSSGFVQIFWPAQAPANSGASRAVEISICLDRN